MATDSNSTQLSPDVQAVPIFIIPDGPCYNPEFQEWEVWVNGEVEAWAETEAQAERSYLEMLGITRQHVSRNPDNIVFINLPRETRVMVVA